MSPGLEYEPAQSGKQGTRGGPDLQDAKDAGPSPWWASVEEWQPGLPRQGRSVSQVGRVEVWGACEGLADHQARVGAWNTLCSWGDFICV